MRGVLVYSERESIALELLTFAAGLTQTVADVLAVALLSQEAAAWAASCFAHGAQRAYTCADPSLADPQADVVSEALAQIVKQAGVDVILIGSTLRGREVASRLAQKLEAACITDANGLRAENDQLIATRYALGGNTISTEVIRSTGSSGGDLQVIAVMPQTFEARPLGAGNSGQVIETALRLAPSPVKTVERRAKLAGSVNVESAEVLVCIGRGVGAQQDLDMIQALADALGGVVCCTRPISHDRHWLPEDQMVGISGKMSSPRLYLGVGVSGQIQHAVGVMGSKVTVAINSDKNAPIFKLADYGVVGDLYQVVPRLTEKLKVR
jgi:electron transfer flavoprotein alpha subunit